MGHSMGGGACFLAADSLCTNGNTNLKTLVGFAPAESTTNGVSSTASAARITVPSLILSGIQDGVTPPVDHHIPMYNALTSACKTILNIIGGGHCYFANSNLACDFGESSSSTGISITRAQQHDVTFDFVNLWLDYTLKDRCDAFSKFQDSVAISTRVTNQQSCNISIPTINTTINQTATTLASNEVNATSYQWLDCDDNYAQILNETNQSFMPSLNGSYAVEILVGGCKAISNCISFPENLGTNESILKNIKFYPNPTNDFITIKSDATMVINVSISDINGNVLLNKEKVKTGDNISINTISSGTYFITFTYQGLTSVQKFIIE